MHTHIPGPTCIVCGNNSHLGKHAPVSLQLSASPSIWTDAHNICAQSYHEEHRVNIKAARNLIAQATTPVIASCIIAIAKHHSVLQQGINRFPVLTVQWGDTIFASGKRPPVVPTTHSERKIRYSQQQEYRCAITGLDLDMGPFVGNNSPSWEHIIPRSLGGPDHISNLIITSYQANIDRRNLQMRIHPDLVPMVHARLSPRVHEFLALPAHRVQRASERSAHRKSNKTSYSPHLWFNLLRIIGVTPSDAQDLTSHIELTPNIYREIVRGSQTIYRQVISMWSRKIGAQHQAVGEMEEVM